MRVEKWNMLRALVKIVERQLEVQYEMRGQNMCIDEMIGFLVFLCCIVVKCSSFWRKTLHHAG